MIRQDFKETTAKKPLAFEMEKISFFVLPAEADDLSLGCTSRVVTLVGFMNMAVNNEIDAGSDDRLVSAMGNVQGVLGFSGDNFFACLGHAIGEGAAHFFGDTVSDPAGGA